MNRMEDNFGAQGEAKLRYMSGEFRIVVHGAYVICAVTGKKIMLEELKYWNADLQEAYIDAEASLKRHQQTAQQNST